MTATVKDYAEALFTLAKDTDTAALFFDALQTVDMAMSEHPDYLAVLASPAIPKRERAALLKATFEEIVPVEVLHFIQLICQNGDVRSLHGCFEVFQQMLEDAQRRSRALVTSATPLSAEEQEKLRARLEEISGRIVRLTCTVDPALIGGLTVEMDGKVFDGSVKHRLQDMKEVMNR